MKVQGTVVVAVLRLNPDFVRSHPGNGPVLEFSRRGNDVCGDGDLESRRLIEPGLVLF